MAAVLLAAVLLVLPGAAQEVPDPTPARQGLAVVHGAELYFEEHGAERGVEGAPLLLVHGFGESSTVWEPYLPALTEDFRLVLVDLRGHGRSTNPAGTFTHAQAAEDLAALMDHLGHDGFRAVGVSSGGMALLHLAKEHPGRVESMVLVGTAPYVPERARQRIRQLARDREGMLAYLGRYATRGEEQTEMLAEQFRSFAEGVDDPAFTPPQLGAIHAPTLIVHGDRDSFFPVELALEMYRAIPESYLLVYPGGGHEPVYEAERVEGFTEVLHGFFSGSWEG